MTQKKEEKREKRKVYIFFSTRTNTHIFLFPLPNDGEAPQNQYRRKGEEGDDVSFRNQKQC